MKSSSRKRGHAFTLVELLVVIGIIAILAGVIVASVSAAIKYAKRTKSAAIAVQLQTAVQNYYVEYGVYPTQSGFPSTTGDAYYTGTTTSLTGWENLIYALCGNINPATGTTVTPAVSNTRSVPFLAPSRSDCDANGVPVNPFGLSGTTGSTYFYMALDTDYSGIIGDSGDAQGKIPNFTASTNVMANPAQPVTGGVAVWCPNDQSTAAGTPSNVSFWAHTY
jgi:prepilin-type N-terminal cleavage/methylation domain-containing protein